MDLKRMKEISDAYKKLESVHEDINDAHSMAEMILERKSNVWISLDFEDDLIKEMERENRGSTWIMSTTIDGMPSEDVPDNTGGISMSIPDTVALEIIGLILRYKNKIVENENHNI